MEHLDALVDFRRDSPQVRRDDGDGRVVGLAQTGNHFATIGGAAHGTAAPWLVSRVLLMVLIRLHSVSRQASGRRGRQYARRQRCVSNEVSPTGVRFHVPVPVMTEKIVRSNRLGYSGRILARSATIASIALSLSSPFLNVWLALTDNLVYSTTVTSAS